MSIPKLVIPSFFNSIIDSPNQEKEDLLIPTSLFEERKDVSFQIPFRKRNENETSPIIHKLGVFTNYKVKFRYFWKTAKVRSLFLLKDPVINKTSVIYKSTSSCSEFYIRETKRNSEVRWREHGSTKKTSEIDQHLLLSPGHTVYWEILKNSPKQVNKWKILEAFYIRTIQPTLDNFSLKTV